MDFESNLESRIQNRCFCVFLCLNLKEFVTRTRIDVFFSFSECEEVGFWSTASYQIISKKSKKKKYSASPPEHSHSIGGFIFFARTEYYQIPGQTLVIFFQYVSWTYWGWVVGSVHSIMHEWIQIKSIRIQIRFVVYRRIRNAVFYSVLWYSILSLTTRHIHIYL